jgi:hypothetical protein
MGISDSIRRTIRIRLGMGMTFVVGIAVLLASLWLDHNRATELPAPTGPYAVGRTTYVWSHASTVDSMAPQPNSKRELLAWIWYPAAAQQPNQSVVDYLPGPWRTALPQDISPIFTHFVSRDSSRVRAYSFRDAEVSPQQRSYPCLRHLQIARMSSSAVTSRY